jgi:1-deoxy-D-xylulose-5-phosphate reductoisomerase
MKKKIAILGSTGSIGKNLLNILNKDKKNFEIILLTAQKNYLDLSKQAKLFKVKNIIITNPKSYLKLKKKKFSHKINIFNDYNSFKKIFKNKIDYTMSSISGIEGLYPTINIIKHTKLIAIANKEAIICGWNILKKELKKNYTNFVPVDSEHFSIYYALKNNLTRNIENVYLTASGGPLRKLPLSKFKNVKISDVLKHPNWSMGKKISIDSATMMNKVFEIIEAQKIFNLSYKKLKILIHPSSYIHAIVKFKDGMIKIIAHDTTMKIPIFNTLKGDSISNIPSKDVDLSKLNNLDLQFIDSKRFNAVKILKNLSKNDSLYDTVIVSANDKLVELYLSNKIKYTDITLNLLNFLKKKEYVEYKKITPKKISDIIRLNNYVRSQINLYYG